MNDIPSEKQILRRAMRQRRVELSAAHPDHAERLAAQAGRLPVAPEAAIGGYCALEGEADPARLLTELRRQGHPIGLPRVCGRDAPLVFHCHQPGSELRPGAFGVREPDARAAPLTPKLVLVPLLAFDAQGHRLGYGGGYYDRTLRALRAAAPITAIGVAFAGQQVGALVCEPFDQPLDGVLTEEGLQRFS